MFEPNPYASPQATPPEPNVPGPARRFRWRVIPVAILGVVGSVAVLGTLNMLVRLTWMAQDSPRIPPSFVLIWFVAGGAGLLMLTAAWAFWTARWALGIGLVIAVMASAWLIQLLDRPTWPRPVNERQLLADSGNRRSCQPLPPLPCPRLALSVFLLSAGRMAFILFVGMITANGAGQRMSEEGARQLHSQPNIR